MSFQEKRGRQPVSIDTPELGQTIEDILYSFQFNNIINNKSPWNFTNKDIVHQLNKDRVFGRGGSNEWLANDDSKVKEISKWRSDDGYSSGYGMTSHDLERYKTKRPLSDEQIKSIDSAIQHIKNKGWLGLPLINPTKIGATQNISKGTSQTHTSPEYKAPAVKPGPLKYKDFYKQRQRNKQ